MKTILFILLVFTVCETKAQMFGAIASQAVTSVNLVTNGTFDTNLDGWTTTSADFRWASNAAEKYASTSGNPFKQVIDITIGETYTVTYTITNVASTIYVTIGSTAGTVRTADGTYTEDIVAGALNSEVSFYPLWNFRGFIDDVIVTLAD